MRKCGKLLMAGMTLLLLCSCGSENDTKEYTASSIVINADGTLTEHIVEEVELNGKTEEARAEELQTFIDAEIADYTAYTGQEGLSCSDCSISGGLLNVTMHYASAEDYAAFNRVTFFTGTVAEALKAGYELKLDATTASDNRVVSGGDIQQRKDDLICITDMPYEVYLNGEVLYYSNSVELLDHASVSFQSVDYGYVIYTTDEQ